MTLLSYALTNVSIRVKNKSIFLLSVPVKIDINVVENGL